MSGAIETYLVEPRINGGPPDAPIFVIRRKGDLWLPAEFLGQHGVKFERHSDNPPAPDYILVGAIAAMSARLDIDQGRLDLSCGALCFGKQTVEARNGGAVALSPVAPGGFLNYDLFAQGGSPGHSAGAYAEFGVFSDAGTGLNSLFCSTLESGAKCDRLETSWTIDDPSRTQRLVIGDTTTQAARWEAPARFGGVRWSTDFSLQPDFVSFPTPVVQGESTLPSSIDVYIDDALRFQTQTPAGPFRITDIPVVDGAGVARTVVTDLLGREQSIVTDYYASPQLLKPGLDQFSLEAGFLRQGFGTQSSAYGDPFVAGGYSRGLTDTLTVGVRSELGAEQRSLGLSAMLANPAFGESDGAVALSDGEAGAGAMVRLAQEYKSPLLTAGSVVSIASPDFRVFGSDRPIPRLSSNAFVGLNSPSFGSASITWTFRDERDQQDFSAFGLHYASRFLGASISVTALKTVTPQGAYVGSLSISLPLGGGASSSAGVNYDGHRAAVDLRAQRDPPPAGGLGYHVRSEHDGVDRNEAGILVRSAYGDAALDYSSVNGSDAMRVSARGGVAVVDGEWFAAPSVGGGMAVVSVGREPSVRVFHDRQLVGVTGDDGKIVIPALRPFERNAISFEPEDLGLAVHFDRTETIVTPGYRTGHIVRFDATRSSSVTAKILGPDGAPLPVGASVVNADTGETYPVGSAGTVFIAAAAPVTRLAYRSLTGSCEALIKAPLPSADRPIPDAGQVTCRSPVLALQP